MNYRRTYDAIIERAKIRKNKNNVYYEKHHILPRSLGGGDEQTNIVQLTAREHFICHFLLTKICKKHSKEWYKMIKAFYYMKASPSIVNARYFNSRLYANLRKSFCEAQSISQTGEYNSAYGLIWIVNKKLKQNARINKQDKIPEGWEKGRIIDFNKIEKIEKKQKHKLIVLEQRRKYYEHLYEVYNQYGWTYIKENNIYTKSKPNLVMQFQKYVKDFKPQNGKRRGR